jgi:RNA-binding protein 39
MQCRKSIETSLTHWLSHIEHDTACVGCICRCVLCPAAAQILLGQPVMVKPAEAEKNLAWEAAQAAKQAAPADADLLALGLDSTGLGAAAAAAAAVPSGPLRLQVSGFKQGLGENEIRQIFEPFGPLDSVTVVRDASGQPISIAYVVFGSGVDGRNAMAHWNGQMLLDHVLTVTATAVDAAPGAAAGGGGVGVGELDDGEGGLRIDAQVRGMATRGEGHTGTAQRQPAAHV